MITDSVSPRDAADRTAPTRFAGLRLPVFALVMVTALLDVMPLQVWDVVKGGFYDSDWLMYYHAAERSLHGADPYLAGSEFRNPPPFLLMARLLQPLGYMPSRILWCTASMVMLLAAGYFVCDALRIRLDRPGVIQGGLLIAVAMPTVLLIPTAGNSTAPIVLSYAAAIWFFTRGMDGYGGGALCVGVLVKPQLVFLTLPLLLYKRRWRAAAAFAGAGCASMLISLLVLGKDTLDGFMRTLSSTDSDAGSLGIWVRDIPGLHAMFLQAWPGSAAAGGAAYLLSGVLVLALAYSWRGAWLPSSPRFACGWAALILVELLATPYAHTDDLVLLLVPIAVLCAFVVRPSGRTEADRWVVPAIAVLYLAPTLVVYTRLHFPAIAMLAALVLLWKLAPRIVDELGGSQACT
jgi:hypothetical protein